MERKNHPPPARAGEGFFVPSAFPLVLTGTEPGRDGRSVMARMTLEPVLGGVARREWAVSEDGEAWETEMALVFTRE